MKSLEFCIEDGYSPIPPLRLNDAEYVRALQTFPVVCTDALIFDRRRRTVFLAKRRSKPKSDYWVIGGRTLAGEDRKESMRRIFKRETNLDISLRRFKYLFSYEYLFKNRQQEPQNIGCHSLIRVFSIALGVDEREIVSRCLDGDEYEGGLREFTRKDLIVNKIDSVILRMHDSIF